MAMITCDLARRPHVAGPPGRGRGAFAASVEVCFSLAVPAAVAGAAQSPPTPRG